MAIWQEKNHLICNNIYYLIYLYILYDLYYLIITLRKSFIKNNNNKVK